MLALFRSRTIVQRNGTRGYTTGQHKRRANSGELTRSHVVRVVYSIRLTANYFYMESKVKTKVQSDEDENTQAMAVHIVPG